MRSLAFFSNFPKTIWCDDDDNNNDDVFVVDNNDVNDDESDEFYDNNVIGDDGCLIGHIWCHIFLSSYKCRPPNIRMGALLSSVSSRYVERSHHLNMTIFATITNTISPNPSISDTLSIFSSSISIYSCFQLTTYLSNFSYSLVVLWKVFFLYTIVLSLIRWWSTFGWVED